ncbi:MAG: aminotransferase class V-fold PLP-dependent enzyme [Candidatus Coatesbacteria bacterium]|nr:aminotransferase class V-fold PLP-dependent enzyme [Candidatus Coatesbacteria bacterium]
MSDTCIYLNNAATSYPKPEPVLRSIADLLNRPPFHHARTGFEHEAVDIVGECRKELAALFGAPDPNRIIFTSGSTESLNLALYGLPLKGKHVVTTTIEHNSVLRPLKTMEREGLITISIVGCDENGFVPVEEIEVEIREDTGAIVVNHCSNVTGAPMDIEAIGQIARQRSIPFVVDVSQSAGIYPIDVERMNIDVLAFTGHKSLYGLQGIGGAYIREDLELKPLKIGGTGVRSDYLFQPETVPMYYEAGTQNLPGIVSLYEGVKFIRERNIDEIRKHKERLVSMMKGRLSKMDKIVTFPNGSCDWPTTIFCFNIKGMDPADVGYILENSFNIVIRSGLHCAPLIHARIGTFPDGSVRVSPSFSTTDDDAEALVEAVEKINSMVD